MKITCIDHSQLSRFGLKGTAINTHLAGFNLQAGELSNRAYLQEDGRIAVRLGSNELLVLADPGPGTTDQVTPHYEDSHYCYRVARRDTHYWYAVSGTASAAVLAKLCGVNFDPASFDKLQVAQTLVARTVAVVIRHDDGTALRYHLLGDCSYSAYMWRCMNDAMAEFN